MELRMTVMCNRLGIFGESVRSGDIGLRQSVTVSPFHIGLGSVERQLFLYFIITLL